MTGSGSSASITVVWGFGDEPTLARRLVGEVYAPIARGGDDVRLSHLCPSCGSVEHGVPLLSGDDPEAPFVSISHAGRLTVVAVSPHGPVGVDVEAAGAADFAGFDRVALHPAEEPAQDPTMLWVRKESVLKATGHGLRVEPSLVRLTPTWAPPELVEWDGPGAAPTAWMFDVETAPQHVAALTVLAPSRPGLVVRKVREGPVPTANA